jgi:hypothetical protein
LACDPSDGSIESSDDPLRADLAFDLGHASLLAINRLRSALRHLSTSVQASGRLGVAWKSGDNPVPGVPEPEPPSYDRVSPNMRSTVIQMSRHILLTLMLATSTAAWGQDAARIELRGNVVTTRSLTLEALSTLPNVEMDITFQTSKGKETGHYGGALLWDVLQENGFEKLEGHNKALEHSFAVTGRDGYKIVFSLGEIAPDFGNAQVLLAYERDGKSLLPTDGFRVVVPGDKRGARAVKDVVSIDVQ